MAPTRARKKTSATEYYDSHGVLGEIIDDPVDMTLDDELRACIIEGKRRRKLKNVSIKMDPLHIQAIRKIATMRAIPYQTLIRQWLTQHIREELPIEPK